jgi:hypothetical protein
LTADHRQYLVLISYSTTYVLHAGPERIQENAKLSHIPISLSEKVNMWVVTIAAFVGTNEAWHFMPCSMRPFVAKPIHNVPEQRPSALCFNERWLVLH